MYVYESASQPYKKNKNNNSFALCKLFVCALYVEFVIAAHFGAQKWGAANGYKEKMACSCLTHSYTHTNTHS